MDTEAEVRIMSSLSRKDPSAPRESLCELASGRFFSSVLAEATAALERNFDLRSRQAVGVVNSRGTWLEIGWRWSFDKAFDCISALRD
jgi:hypothetical protein